MAHAPIASGSVPKFAPAKSPRDWRIDFWRGLAIVFILWNHSSDNFLSWFTTKYYGVSDSAELFVFLSGFAMASMFLAKFSRRPVMALPYAVGRSFTLYLHHISAVVVVASLAVLYHDFAGSSVMERDLFLRPLFLSAETTMPKLATLAYLPPLLDILPLYILLTLLVGVLFFAFRDRWTNYVAFAVVVWLWAWITNTSLSSFPDTRFWSFNPFCWQAVFLAGFVACIVRDAPWLKKIQEAPATTALAITVAILGFIYAAPWATLGLLDWRPLQLSPVFTDKAFASPIRLIHFLALAHLATLLVKPNSWLQHTFLGRSVMLIGRRSLPLFVVSSVFAAMSYGAFDYFGRSFTMQLTFSLGMASLLIAIAHIAEALAKVRDMKAQPPVPAAPRPEPTQGLPINPATAHARPETR